MQNDLPYLHLCVLRVFYKHLKSRRAFRFIIVMPNYFCRIRHAQKTSETPILKIDTHESAAKALPNLEMLLWLVFGAATKSHIIIKRQQNDVSDFNM